MKSARASNVLTQSCTYVAGKRSHNYGCGAHRREGRYLFAISARTGRRCPDVVGNLWLRESTKLKVRPGAPAAAATPTDISARILGLNCTGEYTLFVKLDALMMLVIFVITKQCPFKLTDNKLYDKRHSKALRIFYNTKTTPDYETT